MKYKIATLFNICFFTLLISVKAQYYTSIMPAFYTNAGDNGDRFTFAAEFGKQWDVFSVGLDIGKTNMNTQHAKDTTWYSEIRTNLNVFQQNKFTNTLTMGLGYVFNAHQNIMIETTTGVEYSVNNDFHLNIFFGTYFFSGKNSASNNNFFGMSAVRFFHKKKHK